VFSINLNNHQISLPAVENVKRLRLSSSATYSAYVVIRELTFDMIPMPTGGGPEPTGTNINTSISADTTVSILIKDKDGNVVRRLVDNEQRSLGSYQDYWNAKDDNGMPVNDGLYYALMHYKVDGQQKILDMTGTTGGSRFNPSRQSTGGTTSNPVVFEPFEDEQLPVRFSLNQASEVTLFTGTLYTTNLRLRTILNRVPMPAGNHTVYWDGLDDQGNVAEPPPGNRIILGIWGYTLPNNAMFMTGGRPEISNVAADPNYFSPFSEKCDANGMDEGVLLSYSLSEPVEYVELRVYSLKTGDLLRSLKEYNVSAGEQTLFWDGKNNNGEYVDIGDYQVGLLARDGDGNESMLHYTLVRVEY